MKSLPYREMLAALRLARAGKLVAAATLLERTVRGTEPDPADHAQSESPTIPALPGKPAVAADWAEGPDAVVCDPSAPAHSRRSDARFAVPPIHERRAGRVLSGSFSNAAGTRAYKLFIPGNYDGRPCALIVMLHGCTQSASDFAAGTRMNEIADERTFLVAYPEQLASANASRCWNWFSPGDQERDRGEPSIIAGITRQVMHDYAVDPERVYVAGLSAGGAAAAVLAATYPDIYAALAVHSGIACGLAHDARSAFATMRSGIGDGRASELRAAAAPIPTIVFHGDRDATVHPRNGERFAEGAASADWTKHIETERAAGGRMCTRTTYTNARGQEMLEQWVIHGGAHAWSGGSASGSYTEVQGPDASREIVRFFFGHRRSDVIPLRRAAGE